MTINHNSGPLAVLHRICAAGEPITEVLAVKCIKVGATYMGRFMSDYDSKAYFTIISRTAKQVTFSYNGKIEKRGIRVYAGREQFKPFGTYSMCMVSDADDLVREA